ncbi:monofunctional biosynthetic peptidoglycan transglycosylase [Cereibacter azotoformans]|uniref:Biosynthetic peptidoglycan transglycosylase n=1 Tax=Cereibacter sphaeroides (strain ATCC 17025 / ATH 2.4.3) TaxID=349102 RepID=A4WWA5_CERS5|nr:monofunctional biosynthetic peptidoglycan transglycosylase [Cereibacter azotoformans]ULB11066.1 monofunctional biosynthetic peptidoglycan transglycosylase [Cereibacter azotoformans]
MTARKTTRRKATPPPPEPEAPPTPPLARRLRRWALTGAGWALVSAILLVLFFGLVNPPATPYMISESVRLGSVDHEWADWDEIAPVMARSVVAAEDANFCLHWGFDMAAIRAAINAGGNRGASTLSQQVTKNVFLWQGRSWPRKALEAMLTPLVETIWTKRRILEVYLNVAEFDEGVFGIRAASEHYFGVESARLTAQQAARLAAVLPDPKVRSASNPGPVVRRRSAAILDGANTIRRDGRAACFE